MNGSNTTPVRVDPWERQSGESAPAFEAFARYLEMGATRSLSRVGQELGKSVTLAGRWSAAHGWVARVAAWEADQHRTFLAETHEQRRVLARRQARLASSMQSKVVDRLRTLDAQKLSPRDVAYWLEVSVKIERAAWGIGDRVELTGAGGGPVETTVLTAEERAVRLREIQQAITAEFTDEGTDEGGTQ